MELHELQREIMWLQSSMIAIRSEKSKEVKVEKLKQLQWKLNELSLQVNETWQEIQNSNPSTSPTAESLSPKTVTTHQNEDTPTP